MSDEKKAGTVEGIRDVFATVLDAVSTAVAASVKTGTHTLDAVGEMVKSSVRGAVGMGSDLAPACKAIIMGVIRGSGETGEAALKTLSHAARIVVRQTADMGGDLAAATKGLVLGAIASAKAIGVDTARAASTAAQGIMEGAGEAGSVTVERVKTALKEPIGGSKVVIPEPLAK